jgi:hypothetical protein
MAISGRDDHCSPSMARPADSPGRTWKITGVFTAATKVKSHPIRIRRCIIASSSSPDVSL